jgi:phosphate transport system protein
METRHVFQEELLELERRALEAFDMVAAALERAMAALAAQDLALAEVVVADDDHIDARYAEVHQGILSLLARQAPVATDLRRVAALLDVIKHVERMGDQCVNIAKMIPLTGPDPTIHWALLETLLEMGRQAGALVEQSKRAFGERDEELARELLERDLSINRLGRECFVLAIEIGDRIDTREWAMSMLLVARAIERIGDNAVDIGEQTVFVVTGLFREFTTASSPPG